VNQALMSAIGWLKVLGWVVLLLGALSAIVTLTVSTNGVDSRAVAAAFLAQVGQFVFFAAVVWSFAYLLQFLVGARAGVGGRAGGAPEQDPSDPT
jgi:hypothetical protein